MPITRTSMVDDDGSGTTGTIINNAWKQEFYGQIDAFGDGVWVDIPFNAANYSVISGSGTWTVTAGNQRTLAKVVLNQRTMALVWFLENTSTTGSNTTLGITIPGLATIGYIAGVFSYFGSMGTGTGLSRIYTNPGKLELLRDIAGTTWPAATGLYLMGQIWLRI
jgi:hypothetical protein